MRYVNIHTHRPQTEEITLRQEGIHPWQAECFDGAAPTLSADCEAVGEIGLDFACEVDRGLQARCFEAQLQVAEEQELPVVLHCVKAFEEVVKYLFRYRLRVVIFHGFIGSWQQAEKALSKGWYLSFGERSLRSPRTVEVLCKIPLDRLFLESDDSPTPIAEIYQEAARLRGVAVEELQAATIANYEQVVKR